MAENYIIPKQTLNNFLDNIDYILSHRPITNPTRAAMRQQLEDFRAAYINISDTHQHLWGVQEATNGVTTIYCTTCGVTKTLGKSYTKIFSMDKSPTFSCANCGHMVEVVHLYAGHLICGDCADRYDPDYSPLTNTHQHTWTIKNITQDSAVVLCTSCNVSKTFSKLYTPTSDLPVPNPFSCVSCRKFSPLVYSHDPENLCLACFHNYYGSPKLKDIINHAHVWILEPNERWFVCAICGTTE